MGEAFHTLPLPKGTMENNQINRMPIRAHPYEHQQKAYEFACRLFGLKTEVSKTENLGQMRLVREYVSEGKITDS